MSSRANLIRMDASPRPLKAGSISVCENVYDLAAGAVDGETGKRIADQNLIPLLVRSVPYRDGSSSSGVVMRFALRKIAAPLVEPVGPICTYRRRHSTRSAFSAAGSRVVTRVAANPRGRRREPRRTRMTRSPSSLVQSQPGLAGPAWLAVLERRERRSESGAPTHSSVPSTNTCRFHTGNLRLTSSTRSLQAAKASLRCAAETAAARAVSPTRSRPTRCETATAMTPSRAAISAATSATIAAADGVPVIFQLAHRPAVVVVANHSGERHRGARFRVVNRPHMRSYIEDVLGHRRQLPPGRPSTTPPRAPDDLRRGAGQAHGPAPGRGRSVHPSLPRSTRAD